MDVIYHINQLGNNRVIFNYAVGTSAPTFKGVFKNPWTKELKEATLVHEGIDKNWRLNIIGIGSEAYQDLTAGVVYFDHLGTWDCAVYLTSVEPENFIANIKLQVID